MKMHLFRFVPFLLVSWLTVTTIPLSQAFLTSDARPVSRQPWHGCFAKSSRGQFSTQSFAVSVDSPSTLATEDEAPPYVENPTTTATSLIPFVSRELTPAEYERLVYKAINAIILAISFGSAIYAILNVDAGMTRGWTQSEIAMRIPLDTWSSYEAALEEKPVVTKTIINVVIYLLGDWLSQTAFQKKNVLEFDALRTLRNGFIGLCFGPLVVYYYQFSDHILPVDGGLANRVGKILMDQTIYLSVKCSIYIMAVGLLQGDSPATAAQNVKDKLKGIVFTAWKFWPLVHCVTYSVIPAQHRILWVNMVDLVWNAILATISQKTVPLEETPAVVEQLPIEKEMTPLTGETPLEIIPQYYFVTEDSSEQTIENQKM